LIRYVVKFGLVGVVGLVIDVGIFNLLRTGPVGDGAFFADPIGAKMVSVTCATVATWFGNRYWTFRPNRRKNFILEFLEFATVAVIGMGVSILCLFISHYVLGFTSLLADNISANVIGLFFATVFRFLMYRYWVYGDHRSDGIERKRRELAASNAFGASSADHPASS
jgi:putative flippase GtrA